MIVSWSVGAERQAPAACISSTWRCSGSVSLDGGLMMSPATPGQPTPSLGSAEWSETTPAELPFRIGTVGQQHGLVPDRCVEGPAHQGLHDRPHPRALHGPLGRLDQLGQLGRHDLLVAGRHCPGMNGYLSRRWASLAVLSADFERRRGGATSGGTLGGSADDHGARRFERTRCEAACIEATPGSCAGHRYRSCTLKLGQGRRRAGA